MEYIQQPKKHEGCVFCQAAAEPVGPDNLVVAHGRHVFLIINRFPYTSGHLMIVPYVHQPQLSGLDSETRAELIEWANQATGILSTVYHPEGFNLGMNIGEVAGAGIAEHIHMHIVPRWGGDTNFMSSLADTRVLPELLADTWTRIKEAWDRK